MKTLRHKRSFLPKLFAAVIVAEMFLLPGATVFAKSFPSASSMAAELEQRYHINTGAIQNAGETFNVSDNKKTVPEVSLFFSPVDPKNGEKITARAFPIYFSNPPEQLYYTWFLRQLDRNGKMCDIDRNPSATQKEDCDDDGDGRISENDWKVRAARIIAQNGYENTNASYLPLNSDPDSDGFNAANRFGGAFETGRPDWCYIYDSGSGKAYEITRGGGSFAGCDQRAGERPVCLSETTNVSTGGQVLGNGETFVESPSGEYFVSGVPSCSGGAAACPSGTIARCVGANDLEPFSAATGRALGACVAGNPTPVCRHLFPSTNGNGTTGDGEFDNKEERFWRTDPKDADTADNGGKDEASVLGLGIESFTWNYQPGDMVGVGVEGTSVLSTKHDDSSSMIMWAFSKNKCDVGAADGYTMQVRGYNVFVPTTDRDVNDCVKDNLVDPIEGGQAKRLEVSVSLATDNPMNDESAEKGGDVVSAIASVVNSSKAPSEALYEWKVSISDRPNNGTWTDITAKLVDEGLLPASRGAGMSSIAVSLNLQSDVLRPFGLNGKDVFYLKLAPTVTENFSSGVARSGKSDAVVRVSNTTNKIVAYTTSAALSGGSYKMSVSDGDPLDGVALTPICNVFYANPTTADEAMTNLNKIACRVMKNEIIGLRFADTAGLSDFRWELNGEALACSDQVSDSPECRAGKEVFFAVAGSPGETYTIKANAVNTTTGKTVTLARTFQIVAPEVSIVSDDEASVWPRYTGTQVDLDGNTFDEYSDIAFETHGSDSLKLRAKFLPGPARFFSSDFGPDGVFGTADDVSRRVWTVDGVSIDESNPFSIDYAATVPKSSGEAYAVSFRAALVQPDSTRQALRDIWGIDTLASSESRISSTIQVSVVEPEDLAQGPKKFFATVSNYLPASILFAFKIMLSMTLLLFTVGFVFALIPPEPRTDEVILSRRDD